MASPVRVVDRLDERLVTRAAQAAMAGLVAVGVAVGNGSLLVNAGFGFLVTLVPPLLARDFGIHLRPLHALWLSAAVVLHAVGIVGPYHTVWWWDHVTHTLSAGLVAAAAYVTVAAVDEHVAALYLPPRFLFVFTVLTTLAAGVLWELAEFGAHAVAGALGQEPVLVVYGVDDVMTDLVFDAVGAVLVAGLRGGQLRAYAAVVASRVERSRES
jgi:hypothetical protein